MFRFRGVNYKTAIWGESHTSKAIDLRTFIVYIVRLRLIPFKKEAIVEKALTSFVGDKVDDWHCKLNWADLATKMADFAIKLG